ncbi:MAG: glycosyltransferase [Acidimicrobiales bacterium]
MATNSESHRSQSEEEPRRSLDTDSSSDTASHSPKQPDANLIKAAPRSNDEILVLRAANNWDGPWFADQQLAVSLSKHVTVLYVDPAVPCLGNVPKDALVRPWLRSLGPRLTRLSPIVLPASQRYGMARLTSFLVARSIQKTVRESGKRIDVLIDCAPLAPVLGRCGEGKRVYWAQDDFVAMADLVGVSRARMRRGEHQLAHSADLIVAANPRVAEQMSQFGVPTALIPFGCDPTVFGRTLSVKAAPDIDLRGRIAGFMGYIGERIDVALLEAVAASGVSLLLVGPRHPLFNMKAFDALLSRPNVQWVGPRPFEELPGYLAAMDVGLVPYTHSAFNQASFPLKTLEYLAAGRPVVATDLPAIVWLDCPFIHVADTPVEFAKAVAKTLDSPPEPAMRKRLQAFASQHTWDVRADQFLQEIETIRSA